MSTLANIIQTSNEHRTSDSSFSGRYNVRKEEDKNINMSQQGNNSQLEQDENENLSEDTENNQEEEEDEQEIKKNSKKKFNLNNLFTNIKFLKKTKPAKTESEYYEGLEQSPDQIQEPEATSFHNQLQEQEPLQNLDSKSIQEPKELYFQTKIRNTGYWGKVKIRKGTWFVIIGLVLMSIGITVVSVFWRFWYGPAVNIPCRTAGITFLSLGFFSFIFGLISNYMMVQDPLSKHFIGSPPRLASWILLASIFGLIIASDLMTIYYTYWHNRFVNNPMIALSIILFFFSPIAFVWSILRNFSEMKKMRLKFDPEYARKFEEKKSKKIEKKNKEIVQEEREEYLDETIDDVINNEEDFQLHDETSSLKKAHENTAKTFSAAVESSDDEEDQLPKQLTRASLESKMTTSMSFKMLSVTDDQDWLKLQRKQAKNDNLNRMARNNFAKNEEVLSSNQRSFFSSEKVTKEIENQGSNLNKKTDLVSQESNDESKDD
ncbi:hypothetical protein BpHYR1_042857 [Brachionus plicatilis]|uniref:Transmembrane protein n=1 Tax=Brachionus plicatilis TaxID=10195 RepID=A0A3M7PUN6_BRAPC|nr:hypothetical protein BpHYR1_042857 [Brachionus plicatilis]